MVFRFFNRMKDGEDMPVYPSGCIWKGRRVFFTFGVFLRKDAFIRFAQQCDDFDGIQWWVK